MHGIFDAVSGFDAWFVQVILGEVLGVTRGGA